MPDEAATDESKPGPVTRAIEGAFGAGLVLVFVPCVALYYGAERLSRSPVVGLPILAIFGIMILFGALALIATLFARLGLSDRTQPLGLPTGSIRAAIALSLIVLFATVSIMLYETIVSPTPIPGLLEEDKNLYVKDHVDQVIAVVPECKSKLDSGKIGDCPASDRVFTIYIRNPQSQQSADLAKQLLILIGTLMTSVTSFYFASRANEAGDREKKTEGPQNGAGSPNQSQPTNSPAAEAAARDADTALDGCDVPITNATSDDELPAAKGGVAT